MSGPNDILEAQETARATRPALLAGIAAAEKAWAYYNREDMKYVSGQYVLVTGLGEVATRGPLGIGLSLYFPLDGVAKASRFTTEKLRDAAAARHRQATGTELRWTSHRDAVADNLRRLRERLAQTDRLLRQDPYFDAQLEAHG